LKPDQIKIKISSTESDWITASITGDKLTIKVLDNDSETERKAIATLTSGSLKLDVIVKQKAIFFAKDKKVTVSRVTATSEIATQPATLMIDGNVVTYFNSMTGAITNWPFLIDFYFDNDAAPRIDYLVYTARQDGGVRWGAFGEFELWVATKSAPALTKIGDYDFEQKDKNVEAITFDTPLLEVTQIEFRVKSGFNDRVSCGEMEFFALAEQIFDPSTIFTDPSCSEIIPGKTIEDINKITDIFYKKIAIALFNGTYDSEFRIANYRPYQHPDIQAAINKSNKYNLKDNVTGMYVKTLGENLVVFVGDTKGQNLTLNIRDYLGGGEETLPLRKGINVLAPSITGLMYIYNHTNDNLPLLPENDADRARIAAKTVKVHFATGEVNGYFDIAKHTNSDWARILADATYLVTEVIGKYTHVAWTTADYRSYKTTDIEKMVNYFDTVLRQQHEFMGLHYYHGKGQDRLFKNRSYLRVDRQAASPNSSDYRTVYVPSYAEVFCTEQKFLERMWVIGHEVGHGNQLRPGVKFAGTTEVTNNLYVLYNQEQILGEAKRLFDNSDVDGYGFAFREIIDAQQPWFLPEKYNNHIPKVVPFWQLYLYFVHILGQEHFYHDLYEHFRVTPDIDQSAAGDNYYGLLQLDFVRQVCRIGQRNLTDFFETWGFLRPVDTTIDDYGNKRVIITAAQIASLKNEVEAMGYPKPEIAVEDLTDKNYKGYVH
jgi:hypothetical protein